MTKQEIIERIIEIYNETPGNVIDASQTDDPEIVGLKLYEQPLIGFGSALDKLFETYKEPEIVGPWMLSPEQWLPEAKSVISVFMPFTERVKKSNARMTCVASQEWAYARIEGQAFLNSCMLKLAEWFRENGVKSAVPAVDKRFHRIIGGRVIGADAEKINEEYSEYINESTFSSTWSERHAAFVCGLGTFGMSRGLITAKGMAGRFGSVIVSAEIEADSRPYTDIYEYCIRCGACARNCPANAFSIPGEPKDHRICAPHVSYTGKVLAPRYGCGLCQVKVPCQDKIPKALKR